MKHGFLLLFSSLLLHNAVRAQLYEKAFAQYAATHPRQKIFVHLDQVSYVPGETIYFKAYLYSNGQPSTASVNGYVQLRDGNGKAVTQLKFPVAGATVNGSFDLPANLPEGVYQLVAYTAQQAGNQQTNDVFVQPLLISSASVIPAQSAAGGKNIQLQFFPESGHLLDEITTVVAFRATDENGWPVSIQGAVSSNDGFTVPFQTEHDGMGKLSFRPSASKTYTATINGSTQTFALPAVEKSGVNLKLQFEKGGRIFTLTRTTTEKDKWQNITLVAVINEQVVFENDIDFENYQSVKGHLNTEALPSGILHLYIFNKEGQPAAERLAFVNNTVASLEGDIRWVKKGTEKRAENVLELSLPGEYAKSCSVSITDAETAIPNENMLSHMLLSGEINGYIHHPAYYFSSAQDSVQQALDNLMLTSHWTRYNWKDIVSNAQPVQKVKEPYFYAVSGMVKNRKDGRPVKEGQLLMIIRNSDSSAQQYDLPVGSDGHFKQDSLLIFGETNISYAYNLKGKEKEVDVLFDSTADPYMNWLPALALQMLPAKQGNATLLARKKQYVQAMAPQKELDPVKVEGKSNRRAIDLVNEKYTNGVFRTMGKTNLDLINQPPADQTMNVLDYILTNVRLVQLEGTRFVNPKTVSLSNGSKWTVALFYDDSPAEVMPLRAIKISEIAMIKFYEPGFVGAGSAGPGGAIAIFPKKQGNAPERFAGMSNKTMQGYSVTKTFPSPDFSDPSAIHDKTDTRTTLFWDPSLVIEPGKATTIRFFNNDSAKEMRVVIEGFSADGKLIHIEKLLGQ